MNALIPKNIDSIPYRIIIIDNTIEFVSGINCTNTYKRANPTPDHQDKCRY